MTELATIFRDLETEGRAWIANEGEILGKVEFAASGEMRYAGQAFDITVAIPDALRRKPDARRIAELFHQAHERIYSYRDEGSPVEITTQRVRITGRIPPIRLPLAPAGTKAAVHERRRVFHDGRFVDVPVYLRRELGRGQTIVGPAIVEQEDTTIWILPGWQADVDRVANVVISRPGRSKSRAKSSTRAKPSARARKAKPRGRRR